MTNQVPTQRIDASKVTKPIQLLAAWLIGMILTNGSFLAAAATIQRPDWAASALVIATIANVPIFLFCLFLLQTKFRPEMQEDSFYASYLEKRYSAETGKAEFVRVSAQKVEKSAAILDFERNIPKLTAEPDPPVSANDLLDKFAEISATLEAEGVSIGRTFGSTSLDPTKPPVFVVAIGNAVSLSVVQKVIRVCSRFGLEGVSLASSDTNANRIYIGSYGFDKEGSRFVKYDAVLESRLLSKDLNWQKLREILKDTGINAADRKISRSED